MRMPIANPRSPEKKLPLVELADYRTQDGADHGSPQGEGDDHAEPLSRQIVHTSS
jgi:hypothetical protein